MQRIRLDFNYQGVKKSVLIVGANFQHCSGFLFTNYPNCILIGGVVKQDPVDELCSITEVPYGS